MNVSARDVGLGSYQREKSYFAQRAIFKALYDGQWHRNMELKEKTNLSSRTLSKHLDRMLKLQLIERKVDNESGKYPIPVLYQAQPELINYVKSSMLREEFSQKVDAMLEETKDPLMILEVIHTYSQTAFLKLMEEIKNNKKMTPEEIEFFEENFIWANYKHFTFDLINATKKMVNELDFNKLLVAQAKRGKEISEELIKGYDEAGQAKWS